MCHYRVFADCSRRLDLSQLERNCRFDSCGRNDMACSPLEQAVEECKKAGICVNWRTLTNGTCGNLTFFLFLKLPEMCVGAWKIN